MFISRIRLDPKKKETARALQNRELLHAAIERSKKGDRPHILWRLEPNMDLLAVSDDAPDFEEVQKQFGSTLIKPASKPYDEYLDSINNGDLMRFRVTVNPVINKNDGSKNGKDVPLNLRRTANYPFSAEDWTRKKLIEHGVEVINIQDAAHETVFFTKNGIRIPIFMVTYIGVFRVKNSFQLREIMRAGIGGKKTYGCGLLTAIKIKES